MMPPSRIDHLVVVAPTLAAGMRLVAAALGVGPVPGGRHARMGTHNALLRLGETLYLETIAIDADAPPPDRPRWFGLDALAPSAAPRLVGWVARTDAVDLPTPEPLGRVEPMARGSLRWRITIPDDGGLPLGGAAPMLIAWDTEPHPAAGLPDVGCSLVALELAHPEPHRVHAVLAAIGLADRALVVTGAPEPRVVARIATPSGVRTL